jgi:predicted nucleotidyltransferase
MTRVEVAPLLDAAAAAVDALQSLGLPVALVGGFAVAVRGRPRLTQDIDLVVLSELDALEAVAASLRSAGFSLRQTDAVDFARTTRVLLLHHDPSGIDVDLSFGALPFERELVEAASPVVLSGRSLPIARPEDLIVMKALALRPRDVADIEGLVELNDNLDLDRVRRIVAEFTAALEDADYSAELEQILKRLARARR